jgi:hypothetical protein
MSNAIQLRDASDVTTFRKHRAIQQNYFQLKGKGILPVGGIPHEDLISIARYGATYIPRDSLTGTVGSKDAITQSNVVIYSTNEIVATSCISCSGSSYQPNMYIKKIK